MSSVDFQAALVAPLRSAAQADESVLLQAAVARVSLDPAARRRVETDALGLVEYVRSHEGGLLESLMAEYGLADDEGLALMCLAEAYLRVPDTATIDALLRDKLAGQGWSRHLGHADSLLVNASTFGLLLSSQVLGEGDADGPLRRLVRRAGEPMVRSAVAVAMRRMAEQFVLGRSIGEAWKRAGAGAGARGARYSFDMLGEAARTAADAQRYFAAYLDAIDFVASRAREGADVFDNPGVSVKLSALHPRYQASQRDRLEVELVPRLAELARRAAAAGVGLNVDAEEANRLELSLAIIDRVLDDPALTGWPGFGLVVQAYGKSAPAVIEWCAARARARGTPLAVRLVKGAYWDAEIRHAQLLGLGTYPVYTRKTGTDVAYLAGARMLLDQEGWLYPQFATHNAHTVSAVLAMADRSRSFEFQRLHGMGAALHERVTELHGTPCRVYAPVGAHKDLLAYLVRRMLENGANASFVHQLHDPSVAPAELVRDPVDALAAFPSPANPRLPLPRDLFAPHRRNSAGLDPENPADLDAFEEMLAPWWDVRWRARVVGPRLQAADAPATPVVNPARPTEIVGECASADHAIVRRAFSIAERGLTDWPKRDAERRAAVLEAVADAYEAHAGELLALLIREAGKHRADAIAELREAVDFCRYYATLARAGRAAGRPARGIWVCISPWNFPLAIFTGQIAAALAAGNVVLAKPAEQTPLVATRASELMLGAGVPHDALLLLPGDGPTVGEALVAEPRVAGVSFTGSLETAAIIDRTMAARGNPAAPLVAETGGLNTMIVDSTALPEAAVRDIVVSAFQSAGQRCSALRLLFVQSDVAPELIRMLSGAMDELRTGDTAGVGADVGPVIEQSAREAIEAHIAGHAAAGRLTHRAPAPTPDAPGWFVPPALIRLEDADSLDREIFGPVLHWTTFEAHELESVIRTINESGYGLTFGLHTRIDRRAAGLSRRVAVGNLYVNRNQIGAVVGVQPFGGEGLSGTGPKAGGPNTLARMSAPVLPAGLEPALDRTPSRLRAQPLLLDGLSGGAAFDQALGRMREAARADDDGPARLAVLERAFGVGPEAVMARARVWLDRARRVLATPLELPGPTGETDTLSLRPRGIALCLGSESEGPDRLLDQCIRALATGNVALLGGPAAARVAGTLFPCLNAAGLDPSRFALLSEGQVDAIVDGAVGPDVVLLDEASEGLAGLRGRLAARTGARVPLVHAGEPLVTLCVERVVSVDTTASGGNAQLLALGD